MSLLMEALKKAEEAKRLGIEDLPGPRATPRTRSSSATPGENDPRVLGESPAPHPLDSDQAGQTSARHSNSLANAERTAARNLFSAKQSAHNNTTLWFIGAAALVTALALGGYFWWQLRGIPSHNLTPPPVRQPATTHIPPAPAAAIASESAKAAPAATSTAALTPEPPKEATTFPATSAVAAVRRAPSPAPAAAAPATLPQRETGDTDTGVRLSRSQPRHDATLERAYETLQAGRLDDAQREYEQVLRRDAKNTDALLGLATIAARRGQQEQAHAYYLRALEANPNDATARAGVISTRTQGDAEFSESRLKTALSSQPDSAALLVALGNLYARQERWSEAQQIYFRVYALEPDNPDFLFNLAVSLDHLRQSKLAHQYYQMALAASETRAASFDRNQARNRVLDLQP